MIITIHNLLSIIKNGLRNGLLVVQCPYSRIAIGVLNVLQEHGFIHGYRYVPRYPSRESQKKQQKAKSLRSESRNRERRKEDVDAGGKERALLKATVEGKGKVEEQHVKMEILLKYVNGKPAAKTFSLISKPSKKISLSARKIANLTTSPNNMKSQYYKTCTNSKKLLEAKKNPREKARQGEIGGQENQEKKLLANKQGFDKMDLAKCYVKGQYLYEEKWVKEHNEWLEDFIGNKRRKKDKQGTKEERFKEHNEWLEDFIGNHKKDEKGAYAAQVQVEGEKEWGKDTNEINRCVAKVSKNTKTGRFISKKLSSTATLFRPKPFINGIYILSTTKGIISHITALKCNTGGTVLCKVQ